jgi:hypothetical protein
MTEKIPTWGYSADGAKLFNLAEGENLPPGWHDSPAKVPAKRHPFDHDGDGKLGGSLPKSQRRKGK